MKGNMALIKGNMAPAKGNMAPMKCSMTQRYVRNGDGTLIHTYIWWTNQTIVGKQGTSIHLMSHSGLDLAFEWSSNTFIWVYNL